MLGPPRISVRDARTRRRPAAGTVTSPKQACGRPSARQRGAQPAEPEPQSSRSAQRGRKPTGASTRRAPRSPPHRRRPAPARGRGQCADEAVRARRVGDASPGLRDPCHPAPRTATLPGVGTARRARRRPGRGRACGPPARRPQKWGAASGGGVSSAVRAVHPWSVRYRGQKRPRRLLFIKTAIVLRPVSSPVA